MIKDISKKEIAKLEEASRNLKEAQEAFDELKTLRFKYMLQQSMKRKRRWAGKKRKPVPTERARPPVQIDYPKPACELLSMNAKVCGAEEVQIAHDELLESYSLLKSLDGLAAFYSVGRKTAASLLRQAGVDVFEDMAQEWDSGVPLRELSRRHGASPQTISGWIKKTGRLISPRNSNQKYDEEQIANIFQKHLSVNRAAKAAGVSWETAQKVLARKES